MAEDSISILAYGGAGSGKTSLGLTGIGPTLLLDAETASRFIPKSRKKMWNPSKGEQIPTLEDGQDVVVVRITDWDDVERVMKHLRKHSHPFKTVMFDSISEVQIKAKKKVTDGQFQIQHWGELGRQMGDLLRELRDITADPDSPIKILYLISIAKYTPSHETKNGGTVPEKWEPFLEGSTKNVTPYLFDIAALISLNSEVNPKDPFGEKIKTQTFYTDSSDPSIVAKSRIPGLPGNIKGLTLAGLHRNIFGEDVEEEDVPDVKQEQPEEETKAEKKTEDNPIPGVPTLPEN